MYNIILIFFILISIGLIVIIMLQNSGTDNIYSNISTNSFGSLFNSNNFGNFISYITSVLAVLFFILSLILGNLNLSKEVDAIRNNDIYEKNLKSR